MQITKENDREFVVVSACTSDVKTRQVSGGIIGKTYSASTPMGAAKEASRNVFGKIESRGAASRSKSFELVLIERRSRARQKRSSTVHRYSASVSRHEEGVKVERVRKTEIPRLHGGTWTLFEEPATNYRRIGDRDNNLDPETTTQCDFEHVEWFTRYSKLPNEMLTNDLYRSLSQGTGPRPDNVYWAAKGDDWAKNMPHEIRRSGGTKGCIDPKNLSYRRQIGIPEDRVIELTLDDLEEFTLEFGALKTIEVKKSVYSDEKVKKQIVVIDWDKVKQHHPDRWGVWLKEIPDAPYMNDDEVYMFDRYPTVKLARLNELSDRNKKLYTYFSRKDRQLNQHGEVIDKGTGETPYVVVPIQWAASWSVPSIALWDVERMCLTDFERTPNIERYACKKPPVLQNGPVSFPLSDI